MAIFSIFADVNVEVGRPSRGIRTLRHPGGRWSADALILTDTGRGRFAPWAMGLLWLLTLLSVQSHHARRPRCRKNPRLKIECPSLTALRTNLIPPGQAGRYLLFPTLLQQLRYSLQLCPFRPLGHIWPHVSLRWACPPPLLVHFVGRTWTPAAQSFPVPPCPYYLSTGFSFNDMQHWGGVTRFEKGGGSKAKAKGAENSKSETKTTERGVIQQSGVELVDWKSWVNLNLLPTIYQKGSCSKDMLTNCADFQRLFILGKIEPTGVDLRPMFRLSSRVMVPNHLKLAEIRGHAKDNIDE